MKLMIIVGSVRKSRRADTILKWAERHIKQDDDIELDVADLKDIPLPFFDEETIPSMAHDKFENKAGTAWAKRVDEADAYIIITPEYNYGPPASLKNAIDWVYDGWNNKPVGFISYGGISAGTRAMQQLRQNVQNVKLYSTSVNVAIPFVGHAFDEHGEPTNEWMNDSLKSMLGEIKDLQRKLKS